MKLLWKIISFLRLPVDFLLLTFHSIKGLSWLLLTGLKRMLGIKTSAWPFGCFSQKTSSGRCACLPGRKYGNIFLFRSLCPDSSRSSEGGETFCMEKLQMTQDYWRPPLFRILNTGFFLMILWLTVGYWVYQLAPTTKNEKRARAESLFAKGETLARETKYNEALIAYRNAIAEEPKNPKFNLRLGKCLLSLNKPSLAFGKFNEAIQLDPAMWEAHLEISRLMLRAGKLNKALHHATVVSGMKSDLGEAFLISAYCQDKQGEKEEAIRLLDLGTEKLKLDDAKQFEFAATLYNGLGKANPAITYYKKAIEIEPDSEDAKIGLALLYISQSKWDLANTQIDSVLSKSPDNKKGLVCKAEMFLAQGKMQKAIDQYQNIIKLDATDPQPKTQVAAILYASNHKNKAGEVLQLVLAEHPDYTDALLLSSQLFVEQKRFRLAVANAERISSIDHKKFIQAQNILARTYLELKNYSKAIEASKLVLESNPEDFVIVMGLAFSYQQIGDEDQAIRHYRAASELDPKSHLPYLYLGSLFAQKDETTQAISSFQTALVKAPENHRIANNLAMLLIQRGSESDIQEAYTLVKELKASHENDANIIDTFGWALYHREEYDQALETVKKSINIDPENPSFHYHLGKIHLKQGNLADAHGSLQRSLQLASNFFGAEDARKLLTEIPELFQQ